MLAHVDQEVPNFVFKIENLDSMQNPEWIISKALQESHGEEDGFERTKTEALKFLSPSKPQMENEFRRICSNNLEVPSQNSFMQMRLNSAKNEDWGQFKL